MSANIFNIRPILKCLQEDKLEFYLLALSQKHVRLLRVPTMDRPRSRCRRILRPIWKIG